MRCRHNFPCSSPEGLPPSAMPATGLGKINDHGVALAITLLLLFLMSVIGLAAVLTSSSDLLINGYYRNYRGSFYAADSGLNIARAEIVNYLNNNGPAVFFSSQADATAWAPTWGNNAASYIANNYSSSYAINTHGQAGKSWAESFKILSPVRVEPAQGTPLADKDGSGNVTDYKYTYNYYLTSVGSASGSEMAQIYEQGSVVVTITKGTGSTSTTTSFAAFGAFIDKFDKCQGALVPGYMTGPHYTRGEWNFGSSSTGYTFTDPVSQTDPKFSYWPSSGCVQSSSVPYGSISPQFQAGYNLSSAAIPLPQNDFSQRWAVLDGKGCGENNGNICGDTTTPAPNQPTNADMNAKLKNVSKTAYPTSGASSGVYLPYSCSGSTCTLNSDAGGIYVKGDASVTLSTSGSSGQVFAIKQGTTTTTITVDPVANTTVMTSGTTTLTLAGVPQNLITNQPATMLYVDGAISSISGPSSGAAIQDNSMVTVTANGNITATGDITYKTKPITTSANQVIDSTCCNGSPIDTLIPQYQNMNQVLGLYTTNGNFVLSPTKSGSNIEIDASVAMLSQAGTTNSNIGHMATGNSVGTWTNIGGRIENRAASVSMSKANIYFDRRFTARPNFAPPWFPATTVAQNVITSTITALTQAGAPMRVLWQYQTAGE